MTGQNQVFAADGTPLHFRWTPARKREAQRPLSRSAAADAPTVLITHGLGEHSSRYWHLEEAFTREGFAVARHDLRGHGRSGGRQGDARNFQVFLDDLERIIAAVGEYRKSPQAPLFLYGHSLGGLITLRFLLERGIGTHGIAGAIAASPWLQLAFVPARWKLALAAAARYLCPGFRQITGMDPTRLSRDAEFLAAMPDLHLSHHRLSARLYYEIQRSCHIVLTQAARFHHPLLLLHGQSDPVTSWHATEGLFHACASPDKTLKLYPGVFHETHNDLGREQVLADIVSWAKTRAVSFRP